MKFIIKPHYEKNVRAVLSFFIVLVAFGILLLFITYQNNIIANGSLQAFITMAIIAGGFLIGLLFLANKPYHKYASAKSVHNKTVRSSRTKKKSRRK